MCTAMNKQNISLSVAPPLMERSLHTCQRPPVQSRVAAGFSRFSKYIPKPFLMYRCTCTHMYICPEYMYKATVLLRYMYM